MSPNVCVVTPGKLVLKPFVNVMADVGLLPKITPPVLKKFVKGVIVPPALKVME